MFPSGLNFTQVNPLIQQPEKRVKSTDLQALRVLWERSNCPRLNSPCARHLFPSCLLLLTPCIPPSFPPTPGLKAWDGKREKNKSPLNSKYFWDSSSRHFWGQRRTKASTRAGSGEWGIKAPAKASSSFISWQGSSDKISTQMGTGPDFPASQVGVTLHLMKEALPHPGFFVLPRSTSPKCPENTNWLRREEKVCFQPWSAYKQIRMVSANALKPEDQALSQNSGYLSTEFWRGLALGQSLLKKRRSSWVRGESLASSVYLGRLESSKDCIGLSCSALIWFLPLWKSQFYCFCYIWIFLSQGGCGHCLCSLWW